MATPKTITISDLSKDGKLSITKATTEAGEQAIQIEKRYNYLDDQGEVIEGLSGDRVVTVIAISNIPAAQLSALQSWNNFMYNLSLAKEKME